MKLVVKLPSSYQQRIIAPPGGGSAVFGILLCRIGNGGAVVRGRTVELRVRNNGKIYRGRVNGSEAHPCGRHGHERPLRIGEEQPARPRRRGTRKHKAAPERPQFLGSGGRHALHVPRVVNVVAHHRSRDAVHFKSGRPTKQGITGKSQMAPWAEPAVGLRCYHADKSAAEVVGLRTNVARAPQ